MSQEKTEKRANWMMKLAFRVFINVGVVLFLHNYFGNFFVLTGGYQVVAIVGLTFTALNMLVVPFLNVLALPIKFIAWFIAFIIVNTCAVWLTVQFVQSMALPGISMTIEGGVIGWILVGIILGIGNWMVRAIVR